MNVLEEDVRSSFWLEGMVKKEDFWRSILLVVTTVISVQNQYLWATSRPVKRVLMEYTYMTEIQEWNFIVQQLSWHNSNDFAITSEVFYVNSKDYDHSA